MNLIRRSIERKFNFGRLYEPTMPGYYMATFVFRGEDIATELFTMKPGSRYGDLIDLCEGFCEGYMSIEDLRQISVDRVYDIPADPLRDGLVLERIDDDRLEQGNIYISPKQVCNIVSAAGKAVYGRRIKFN